MKKYNVIYADPAWSYDFKEPTASKGGASHEQTLPIQRVSNSLLSLDGKTIPVTFHVSKFKPKFDIDLSNDY